MKQLIPKQKTFLKAIFGMAVAASLTLTAVPQALAQDEQTLQGTWHVTVTIRDCKTGGPLATVLALNTFLPGGSMFETANSSDRSPSHGTWRHTAGDNYNATFLFFTFNPNGTWVGPQGIKRT